MANPSITDCSGLAGSPQSIFQPRNSADLQAFLREHPGLPLRVGGGLTGVSGGAVPESHETFIDLSALTAISWYDEYAGIIVAEAGATMASLQETAVSSGWHFPVIPGSKDKATVGGMVACNGGGPLSLKYGKMSRWVLGLEIVRPSGEIDLLGGYCTKVSEGCDWKSLVIGSEGTLGIVVRVILKCAAPLPPLHYRRFASEDFFTLLTLIPDLVQRDAYLIEIADSKALEFSSKAKECVLWTALPQAWSGTIPAGVRSQSIQSESLSERFDIGYGLQGYKAFLDLDVCFPASKAPSALRELNGFFEVTGFEHVVFGHAGDGNYHIHVFFNGDEEKWEAQTAKFDTIVRTHDGHLSGEHGIGRIHRKRFNRTPNSIEAVAYKALKQTFDPNGQLPALP